MSVLIVTVLVFIPTIISTGVYAVIGMGNPPIPSLLLFFLVALVFLFPMEWGFILLNAKKNEGKISLHPALKNQEPQKMWKIICYATILFAWAGIVSVTVLPFENRLCAPIQNFLNSITPVYFEWTNMEVLSNYGRGMVIVTCIGYFIFNVFIGPITEEFFFRGYLTNRLEKMGVWAPVIVTVLFSLYHLWLPTNNLFRIVAFLPATLIAWKKKDIRISIFFHCLCNLFSTIGFIGGVLSIYYR